MNKAQIRLLALNGRRSEALAQYDRCRHTLAEEVGLEPAPETTQLYELIRAGQLESNVETGVDKKILLSVSFHSTLIEGPSQDWGDVPDVTIFYGRQSELAALEGWLVTNRCRLVGVLGMGGIGKTALAAKLASHIQDQFEYVFWRSLRNAPPLRDILGDCIRLLSDHQVYELPSSLDGQISLLIKHLHHRRCLLVLDNVETILRDGNQQGHYRAGYEGYGQLFQRVGEAQHQSCLLITSREKPSEFALLESERTPVRTLQLSDLDPDAGQAILQDRGLSRPDEGWTPLLDCYSGNPLALKLAAETIRELFFGNIMAFLKAEATIFSGVRDLLARQFDRLSDLEQETLIWLAIEREPASPEQLQQNSVRAVFGRELLDSLQSLRRRSLLEQTEHGLTLQNVVMEFLTDYLVDTISQEIIHHQYNTENFNRFVLIKAQAKEYVRMSQTRLFLQPVADKVLTYLGKAGLEARLKEMLDSLREAGQPGYAGGNILDLLLHLEYDVSGFDFSNLAVWQANLQGFTVQGVDFSHADLTNASFTDTFGAIRSVTYSPDGQIFAAGTTKGSIRLWRTNDGQSLFSLVGHTSNIGEVAFSPDGQTLASGSADRTVRLWDVRTGHCHKTLVGHTQGVQSVAFSPDGDTLVSSSTDHTVRLWNMANTRSSANKPALELNQKSKALAGHTSEVWSVAFSPDGQTVASGGYDRTVRLWDAHTGQCLKILAGHTSEVWTVAFSSDGQTLASGSADQTVRLWDVANPRGLDTGQCLKTFAGHAYGVQSVAFSPTDQILASSSDDQTVCLWDITNLGRTDTGQHLKTLSGHTGAVFSVVFKPDGQTLASGSYDQTVRLWDVHTGRNLKTLAGYSNHVFSVAFSPDGQTVVSGSYDQTVRLWDIRTGHCLNIMVGHSNQVGSVAFSPNGLTLASGSFDQTVRLWDPHTGKCLSILVGHTEWVGSVAFSPNGDILASAGFDKTVRLWDVTHMPTSKAETAIENDECLNTLSGHTAWVRTATFSPDGQSLASGGNDQTVRLWDVHTGQCLMTLTGHSSTVLSVAFSPDSEMLASGSDDQTVRLWDVHTGQCLMTLTGHSSGVESVAFSPGSHILASGSADQTVRLWDMYTGQNLKTLSGHTHRILSVAFSPKGRILVSSSVNGSIKLWDVQTEECLATYWSDRPYERMNITGVTESSEAQKASLKALGAVDLADKEE